MSSADFGFMTLRNMTAYQTNGARVKPNFILTTSTNGTTYFSDSLRLSSINVSSLGTSTIVASTVIANKINANIISANTIDVNTISANTIDVNTLSTTTHISNNIIASTIVLEDYIVAPLIETSTICVSTVNVNGAGGSINLFSDSSLPPDTVDGGTLINYLDNTNLSSITYGTQIYRTYPGQQLQRMTGWLEAYGGYKWANIAVGDLYIAGNTIGEGSENAPHLTADSAGNAFMIANSFVTSTVAATYISSMDNLVFIDNNNNTIELKGLNDDLYVNGYPVVTEGNISSISSLYWEDTLGTGSLAGAIFNKNLGQGAADYMVGIGTGPNLNGTLSVVYTGSGVVGNAFHVSSSNNYTYLKNAWDGANNGLSLHLEENQATANGARIYLSKSYDFQSSIVGDLGAIKFTGTNAAQSSILGAEITAQQTGEADTFVPTDILFINGTSSVSNTTMIIKDNGNVGIGTINPQAKLDVNGEIFSNSTITANILNASSITNISSIFSSGNLNISSILGTYVAGTQFEYRSQDASTLGTFKIELSGSNLLVYKSTLNGDNATMIQNNGGGPLALGLGSPVIFLSTGGTNVGILKSNPQYTLDVGGATQIGWGANARIGVTNPLEGFSMTWNAIQAGATNGQTELISGRGGGTEGGFDFFVNVADGVSAVAGDLAMRIAGSTKNVGIGTTAPTSKLHVVGDIYASGNVIAGSDIRFKTDIKTIENALSTVVNMRGVSYTAIATQAKSIGVIAQEVEKVLPEVVTTDNSDDKFKAVAYGNMIGLLIEAIKELNQKIDSL